MFLNRKINKHLLLWKDKQNRKPLVIKGARQVGKTSVVLNFAKKEFKNTIYINLEKSDHLKFFKEPLSLEEFEKIIKINFQQNIIPNKTLIFLDEIQNSPSLIKLLRFFKEERPNIHVIATGSLLEVMLKKQGLSISVGRVEYLYLYPLDFFEYLDAKKEKELLKFLQNVKLNEKIPLAIHERAMDIFHEYTMIGGMPEIVKLFLQGTTAKELKSVYSSLFTGYKEDVYKYSSVTNAKYLKYTIENAPSFAGNIITYKKFGQLEIKSREIKMAFDLLQDTMMLYPIPATQSIDIPLIPKNKKPKKLIFLDIGLVNYHMGIQNEYLNIKNLNSFYKGRIAEQIVGQNILSQFIHSPAKLFYWAKDKSKSEAEIDFCLTKNNKLIGIEVKSGKTGKLRSLYQFSQDVKNNQTIRIYSGEFKKEKIEIKDKKSELISIPFYLIPCFLEKII